MCLTLPNEVIVGKSVIREKIDHLCSVFQGHSRSMEQTKIDQLTVTLC